MLLCPGFYYCLENNLAKCFDLATQLKIDFFLFEYSGLGKSDGDISEKESLNDLQEVIKAINQVFNYSYESLVM